MAAVRMAAARKAAALAAGRTSDRTVARIHPVATCTACLVAYRVVHLATCLWAACQAERGCSLRSRHSPLTGLERAALATGLAAVACSHYSRHSSGAWPTAVAGQASAVASTVRRSSGA